MSQPEASANIERCQPKVIYFSSLLMRRVSRAKFQTVEDKSGHFQRLKEVECKLKLKIAIFLTPLPTKSAYVIYGGYLINDPPLIAA